MGHSIKKQKAIRPLEGCVFWRMGEAKMLSNGQCTEIGAGIQLQPPLRASPLLASWLLSVCLMQLAEDGMTRIVANA